MKLVRHPAIISSALALIVLGAASIVRPLPWQLWAVWALLTAVSVLQALTSSQP